MAHDPFSDLLRRQRKELRLTQSDVVKDAARAGEPILQSTLSSWEHGNELPKPGDARLPALATALKLSTHLLEAALHEQRDLLEEQALPNDEGYIEQQQEYIRRMQAEGVGLDIWLVGPEKVPVAELEKFKETWRRNLSAGIHYHLLWPLCLVESGVLAQLTAVLEDLTSQLQLDSSAKIHHYAIELYPPSNGEQVPENLRSNRRDYTQLMGETIPGHIFHQPVTLDRYSKVFEELGRAFSAYSLITICRPRSWRKVPFASIHLPKVRRSMRANLGSVWYLFDDNVSRRLGTLIELFTERLESNGHQTQQIPRD